MGTPENRHALRPKHPNDFEMTGGRSAKARLDEQQVRETLAQELTRRGYSVELDGCSLVFSEGNGFGNPSSTFAVAHLTALSLD